MVGSLTKEQIKQYRLTGQVGPVSILKGNEPKYYRKKLEFAESNVGELFTHNPGQYRAKTHLLYTWMDDLVRHPSILDVAESLIGPNILVYHLTCWIKEPKDGSFVSWHQDGTYFNLFPADHVTAWISLTDVTIENGCMRMLPGSHLAGQQDHREEKIKGNLLSNGQHIVTNFDDSNAINIIMAAGWASFHHTHIIHSSGPNKSQDRRIGIGISYIPTSVRFVGNGRLPAALVRGEDEYGHFEREQRPKSDFDESARAYHRFACEKFFASHGSKRS